ncbi:MAG: PilN domain-containing protein [Candidatus Moranbacteria bacterium]|jgi:hypothetical protein|nr:PilN domain-containing protein [Candidatus Moranbacteria bacterium]MBP9801766.1 PilN domain-containing protein [Candidatus Moranbacteria bacterium]
MPGVNLSQSIVEKSAYQAKSGSEKGRLVVFGLFLLTLAVWGGVRVGMSSYDKKITGVEQQITEKKASFEGGVVNDIADVDARLSLINQEKVNQIYPKTILTGLEGVILPTNLLTDFEYDFENNVITLKGEAFGYKEVAQQLMAFKSSPLFSHTFVSNISQKKDEEGAPPVINFQITTAWNEQK